MDPATFCACIDRSTRVRHMKSPKHLYNCRQHWTKRATSGGLAGVLRCHALCCARLQLRSLELRRLHTEHSSIHRITIYADTLRKPTLPMKWRRVSHLVAADWSGHGSSAMASWGLQRHCDGSCTTAQKSQSSCSDTLRIMRASATVAGGASSGSRGVAPDVLGGELVSGASVSDHHSTTRRTGF